MLKRGGLAVAVAVLVAGILVLGALVGPQFRDESSTDSAAQPAATADAVPQAKVDDVSESDAAASALGFLETKLVGGWSRYHSYDGSRQHAIFNGDRTVCKWEKTASGSVKNVYAYAFWQVSAERNPNGTSTIYYGDDPDDRTLYFVFDYAADEVLMGVDVIASRDPDLLECFS